MINYICNKIKLYNMKKLFFLLAVLLIPIASLAQRLSQEAVHTLQQLDSLLERREAFEEQKLLRIEQLKKKSVTCSNPLEVINYNQELYLEYHTYNPDSAMKYVEKSEHIAMQNHYDSLLVDIRLRKAYLYIYAGILDKAEIILNEVRPALKSSEDLLNYYDLCNTFHSHFSRYDEANNNLGQSEKRAEKGYQYRDSIMMVISPQNDNFWVHQGWHALTRKKNVGEAKAGLENDLQTKKLSFRSIAMHEYLLAHIHLINEDQNGFIIHMSKAGMADIQMANLDMAALNELARVLFNLGDIDHAYNYVNLSMLITSKYGDRIRMLELSTLYNEIVTAHLAQRDEHENKLVRTTIIEASLLILLIITFFAIFFLYQRQKKAKQQLNITNALLQQQNQELTHTHQELNKAHQEVEAYNAQLEGLNLKLQDINQQLQDANFSKEGYIGYVFSICSSYINKLDEFRININRKIKAKKLEEIQQLTNSTFMSQQEVKELLQTFDTVFLHIFPTFIEDFNLLLEPDFQILPKEKGTLNTELRIYALIRLGVTDSVKIAEILHCSSQTIYNYRMKVRSHALLADKKDFIDEVKKIG